MDGDSFYSRPDVRIGIMDSLEVGTVEQYGAPLHDMIRYLSWLATFHQACSKGHTEVAIFLINHFEIDVNLKNAEKETGLYLAWSNQHKETVNSLINGKESKLFDFEAEFHLAFSRGASGLLEEMANGSESSKTVMHLISESMADSMFGAKKAMKRVFATMTQASERIQQKIEKQKIMIKY